MKSVDVSFIGLAVAKGDGEVNSDGEGAPGVATIPETSRVDFGVTAS